MKKIFLLITFALITSVSYSQIEKGVKIIMGAGSFHSANLSKILEKNKESDPYLKRSNSQSRNGLNLGLGYFINYNLNNKVSISTDISLSVLSSHLYINYYRDSSDQFKAMSRRITSESKINVVYLNIPIFVRYSFTKKNNLYLTTGFSINLMANPRLHSKELNVVNTYKNDIIDSTSAIAQRTSVVLDKHNKFQANFIVGIEKRFNNRMKNFGLGIVYTIPLTKGELYTSKKTLNYSDNNKLMGNDGKQEAENKYSDFKLNDFKMSSLNITLKYYLNVKK
jgi:hypothetical protein